MHARSTGAARRRIRSGSPWSAWTLDRPMQSVGLHFFQRGSTHYLILIDHFSGLPIFQKLNKTACKDVVKQLKSWLSLFGVSRLIRADNGPA